MPLASGRLVKEHHGVGPAIAAEPSAPPERRNAIIPIEVLHSITSVDIGGAQSMLLALLATAGPRLRSRVLTLLDPQPGETSFRDHGIDVISLGMARSLPGPRQLARLARMRWTPAPHVHQGWMYHGNLAATALHWRQTAPSALVWGVHHSLTDIRNERPLTQRLIALSARLSRRAAAIVYVSSVSARQHEAMGFAPERTVVIPNGVDPALFKPDSAAVHRLRQLTGAPDGRALVGMVARLHPMKNHAGLIRAAGEAVRGGADLQLVLIGPDVGPADPAIADAIVGAELGDRISFLGARYDMPMLMPGFDVVVTASTFGESFPVVIAEAMAAGVPCIATDLGDCAMLIGDTGGIVPAGDAAALTAALSTWLTLPKDARRAVGIRARGRIRENFSIAASTHRYEALYEALH